MYMSDEDYEKRVELRQLEQDHEDLSAILDNPEGSSNLSKFTFRQLKKRKLLIKDRIHKLKRELYSDIIA